MNSHLNKVLERANYLTTIIPNLPDAVGKYVGRRAAVHTAERRFGRKLTIDEKARLYEMFDAFWMSIRIAQNENINPFRI